jgi:hypothetical protein
MWTDDSAERELFDRIGLLGSLPPLGDAGGFSVSVNNAGSNKIDAYLDRTTDVSVEVDAAGTRRLLADVTLHNGAPATGMPQYVIGNLVGLPDGYSRLLVTFYGPTGLDVVRLDGAVVDLEPGVEAGWTTHRHFIELGPGDTATYRLEYILAPSEAGDDAHPVLWTQPLADHG